MKSYAVRNVRLCTKDCLCLFVCPAGATDTENSVIDVSKCTGCGLCAAACPSGAISMVPEEYPPQQPKTDKVRAVLNALAQSKADGEKTALQVAGTAASEGLFKLMTAIAKSERLLAEDLIRESGFMLPQSGNAHELLEKLISDPPTPDFPVETAKKILDLIPNNDKEAKDEAQEIKAEKRKWVCRVCGYEYEGPEPPYQCPDCKRSGEYFRMG